MPNKARKKPTVDDILSKTTPPYEHDDIRPEEIEQVKAEFGSMLEDIILDNENITEKVTLITIIKVLYTAIASTHPDAMRGVVTMANVKRGLKDSENIDVDAFIMCYPKTKIVPKQLIKGVYAAYLAVEYGDDALKADNQDSVKEASETLNEDPIGSLVDVLVGETFDDEPLINVIEEKEEKKEEEKMSGKTEKDGPRREPALSMSEFMIQLSDYIGVAEVSLVNIKGDGNIVSRVIRCVLQPMVVKDIATYFNIFTNMGPYEGRDGEYRYPSDCLAVGDEKGQISVIFNL